MKKLLFMLFTLVSLQVSAQTETLHFKCTTASADEFNSVTQRWDNMFFHDDINYEATLTKDILSINAKTMQAYRLLNIHRKMFINDKGNSEVHYKAANITDNDRECYITFIIYKNTVKVNIYVFYFDQLPFISLTYSTYRQ